MFIKKVILAMMIVLIGVSTVYSQNIDTSLGINIKINTRRTLSLSMLQGVTIGQDIAMDYLQFDLGYFILKNSELGIYFGKEDSEIGNESVMIGGYYSQHFDEGLHIGLRVGLPNNIPANLNTYNEFYIGNDITITDKFNLRIRLSYSYLSKVFLGFNGDFKNKKLGLLVGFNYLF